MRLISLWSTVTAGQVMPAQPCRATEEMGDPTPLASPHVFCTQPGTTTVTANVTYADGTSQSFSGTLYCIGGPLTFSSTRSNGGPREQLAGQPSGEYQNWFLDYFGFDPGTTPKPNKMQAPPMINVSADFAKSQPAGTELQWMAVGSVNWYPRQTPSGSSCTVCAVSPSQSRGDSTVQLQYALQVGNSTYLCGDCTNAARTYNTYWSAKGMIDKTYAGITCHKPFTVSPDTVPGEDPVTAITGSAPNWSWSMSQVYNMDLFSQIGDPDSGVDVQERFPPNADGSSSVPTMFDDRQVFSQPFSWNGSDNYFWVSGEPQQPDNVSNDPGYNNHGKFTDFLAFVQFYYPFATGMPLSGGTPVLTFTHVYWAATSSWTNGDPGLKLQQFTAKCYTDQATQQ